MSKAMPGTRIGDADGRAAGIRRDPDAGFTNGYPPLEER